MNDIIMTKKHKTININIDKILRSTYKTVLKRFAKFCINTFRKMCNLRIKQIIKTNMRESIICFGIKILEFCLKIETFAQMLKKRSFLQTSPQRQKNDNYLTQSVSMSNLEK